MLKIYDSWDTSGSWKHAHYGGSQLRSEQTKKMTRKLWNVVMWIVIFCLLFMCLFYLFLVHGWAGSAVNRVFLRKKMLYFLDWSGDEPESFVTHYTVFCVWDYSLHRGSSFCCCRFVDHGNRNLDVLIGRDHKVENRTNWWAKLDNRERSNPPLTYPPLRNKGLVAVLIKGNPMVVIIPDHK